MVRYTSTYVLPRKRAEAVDGERSGIRNPPKPPLMPYDSDNNIHKGAASWPGR